MTSLAAPGVGTSLNPAGDNRLKVLIVGTPEIIAAGAAINLNHQKAQALLYYLAATGETFTRLHLATLLWSEAGSGEALHSLRSSLYHLRQGLRSNGMETALVSEGEWLGLDKGRFECDLDEFRSLVAQSDELALARAVKLHRGPLLQGFSMADAPVFDQWLQDEEAAHSQAYFSAVDRLAGWAEQRQEWTAVIGYLQRMIQVDPLDEAVQQRMIRACLEQGEIGLALRQYRQFENQLLQELDMKPASETRELLYTVIRKQRGAAPATLAVPIRNQRQPNILPLTGRKNLLEQLNAISQGVQAGRGSTVLIEGDAGIGKSRLIEEFAQPLIAGALPWIVLQGSCSPFDDLLSYGPFLEAFQEALSEGLPAMPVELDPSLPDSRGRFTWSVLQSLRSLTHSLPLLLIIEDLQWANSSTLNLFCFLSMRLQHLPVLLVGSVQHIGSIPALQRLISYERHRGGLQSLSLAPLAQEDVIALLSASNFEADSVEVLAEWLYVRSGGSPFLLNEILAQLRKEGLIKPHHENWQLDTSRWWQWRRTFELPETTYDLVAWRLANLPKVTTYILEIMAVSGQPLQTDILSDFPEIPEEQLSALLDDLASSRLIVEQADGRLALPHHLLRKTLLHRMSNLRKRRIHRQLVKAMEAHMSWEGGATLLQFAMHAVAGEDIERARRYGLAVLLELPQDYTGAETLDFVHHLHDLLAPSASAAEMATLTHALGAIHQSIGQLEVASQWLNNSLEWAQKGGNLPAQAAAYFEMSELALIANDYRKSMEAARAGLAETRSAAQAALPDSAQVLTLVGRGRRLLGAAFAMEGSDLAAAEEHLQVAVNALRQASNQGDLCAALFELGNISAQRGDLQAALDFYGESARIAEAGHIHYYYALTCNNFAYHSLLLGQIEAAEKSASQGVIVAERYDLLAALLHLYSTRGEIHLYLGEWKPAEAAFQRGLAIAEDLGSLERKAGYRAGLAIAARHQGNLQLATGQLEEALAMISETGYWHLHIRLQIWLAETLFMQERFPEAMEMVEAALGLAREQHRTLLQVQGERLYAQLLAINGDWPAANTLFSETLEKARDLGLALEIARSQAVWGKAMLKYSNHTEEGCQYLALARTTFDACKAKADLAEMP